MMFNVIYLTLFPNRFVLFESCYFKSERPYKIIDGKFRFERAQCMRVSDLRGVTNFA